MSLAGKMKRTSALFLTLIAAIAGCSPNAGKQASDNAETAPDLESAAIAAGVIPDPTNSDVTGLYARDTDRVCIVPAALDFRIGAFVDYGSRQSCSASGTVTRSGETLHVQFDSAQGCEFDARYEGDRIVFPGKLPDVCQKLCSGRASMAALDGALLSNSLSEAAAMRDGRGKLLCSNP